VTGRRLPGWGRAAAAAFTVALLCWPAGPGTLAHAAPARSASSARLTAQDGGSARRAAPPCDPKASLRPLGPPVVTPGSFMDTIRARGHLIVGVDQNNYLFGYRSPFDGQIEGFDIDMLHAIAAAIFGNPDKIRFVALSLAQEFLAVQSGKVDIVAHATTVTCSRWRKVDFSSVYFDAGQRVLVRSDSTAKSLIDLSGQKVCATKGSTSLATLRSGYVPGIGQASIPPIAVAAPASIDCLMLLQQGDVAAISTDDVILAGLKAQDPFTKIIGPRLADEPYGLAISKRHPDFVRFVNAVLARLRANGQWAASYKRWVQRWMRGPVPAPPSARYQG
jgi:polar amino acid transport system substrate-binding protein